MDGRKRARWMYAHVVALAALASVVLIACFTSTPSQEHAVELALRLPELESPILPKPGYETGFPESYFASAPNPTAKYAWVCPGPSRLDDSHSHACPGSGTGGYRCCVNSETGGAVTDDMCCPAQEKQLASALRVPSTESLVKRLSSTLRRAALKLEKEAQPKPPPIPRASYMSKTEAQDDLNDYFNSLAGVPAPKRSLASPDAAKDLDSFFHELGKGTLGGLAFQRKPWKAPPLPDPTQEVEKVATDYAKKLRSEIKQDGAAVSKARFEAWRERSMPQHRSLSSDPLKEQALEEEEQQRRARRLGKATADNWDERKVHYYTATLGGRSGTQELGDTIDLGDGLVGVSASEVSSADVK